MPLEQIDTDWSEGADYKHTTTWVDISYNIIQWVITVKSLKVKTDWEGFMLTKNWEEIMAPFKKFLTQGFIINTAPMRRDWSVVDVRFENELAKLIGQPSSVTIMGKTCYMTASIVND